jgi:hypothetical protein
MVLSFFSSTENLTTMMGMTIRVRSLGMSGLRIRSVLHSAPPSMLIMYIDNPQCMCYCRHVEYRYEHSRD